MTAAARGARRVVLTDVNGAAVRNLAYNARRGAATTAATATLATSATSLGDGGMGTGVDSGIGTGTRADSGMETGMRIGMRMGTVTSPSPLSEGGDATATSGGLAPAAIIAARCTAAVLDWNAEAPLLPELLTTITCVGATDDGDYSMGKRSEEEEGKEEEEEGVGHLHHHYYRGFDVILGNSFQTQFRA